MVVLSILSLGAAFWTVPAIGATPKSRVLDGVYSGPMEGDFVLKVDGNGTQILGGVGMSALDCNPSTSLSRRGNFGGGMTIWFLHSFPISKSRAFSYSGNAKVENNDDTDSSTGFFYATMPITFRGHFVFRKLSFPGGTTIVAVGTFRAPSICASATSPTFTIAYQPGE